MVSRKRYSSPSKGWKQKSPTRGEQRNLIKKKCGSKCFLRPKDNGFPICTSNCLFNCSGLNAAKSRAGQYNYTSIENKAQQIALSNGCKWAKKSSGRNKKSPKRKSPNRKSRVRKSLSRKSASRKSRSKKPCKSNQVRNRYTGRCRNKSRKSASRKYLSRKSYSRKSRVRKSLKKSPKKKSRARKSRTRKSSARKSSARKSGVIKSPKKGYEKAIQDNLKYYSNRDAGKINDSVRSYLKKANQSYSLTLDLLDVASGIAWNKYGRKTVTMRDINLAKTVDSLLEKKFP